MSKIHRGGNPPTGRRFLPDACRISGGTRAAVRHRRLRRTAVIVAALTILVLFATGAVGSSLRAQKDLVDTASSRWHQPQAGRSRPASPTRMRWRRCLAALWRWAATAAWYTSWRHPPEQHQSGYARPAIAAGKTRFVLYNRPAMSCGWKAAPRTFIQKTMDSTIYAVRRGRCRHGGCCDRCSPDSVAKLTVYNSSMQSSWCGT